MDDIVSKIVYFSWTLITSAALGLMTGAIGFLACLLFVRKIYEAIKID
jgi:transmembrane 9 superfamily protein 2/4